MPTRNLRKLAIGLLGSKPMQVLLLPIMAGRASIFMLHRFAMPEMGLEGHDPSLLRRCLERLRRHRVPIMALGDALACVREGSGLPAGTVMFTMDDGFWDQGEVGAEIFLEFDVPVTIFLITGLQDGRLWPWDDRLAHILMHGRRTDFRLDLPGGPIRRELSAPGHRRAALRAVRGRFKQLAFEELEVALRAAAVAADAELPDRPPEIHRPLGWEAARRLEQRGVQFGPHSISHGIVSRMSDQTARHELLGAWVRLGEELSHPVNVYGWPTGRVGDFGSRDIALLREANFLGAVATNDDYADFRHPSDPEALFRLRRFAMPATLEDFIQYSGPIERAKQLARAGILRNQARENC